MEDLNPLTDSSRKAANFPRGEKVTVGVYLDKTLVEKARKHRLNLSKTLTEALTSIINHLESSNCQNKGGIGTVGSDLWGRGRDLNPGAGLHRPVGFQATSPRPRFS